MSDEQKNPFFGLEERTLQFAKNIRIWLKSPPKSISIAEDAKQVARFAGFIGTNYIEANESLSKKDFTFRIKISRKEAIESSCSLRLILVSNENLQCETQGKPFLKKAIEQKKFFHYYRKTRIVHFLVVYLFGFFDSYLNFRFW